jgi:hypothetical protein
LGPALVPAVLLVACGGASAPTPLPAPTPVTSKAFVYVLTDLEHTIAGFEVLPADGALRMTSTLTDARAMSVDPDGRWLYVSSQETTTLHTFAIDREDGSLTLASSIDTRMGQNPPIRFVYPAATRGAVFGRFGWVVPFPGSGNLYQGWIAFGVDQQRGRLTPPGSPRWGLRSGTCVLLVGAKSDFAYADCEPYYDHHALRTWSTDSEGRWREVSAVSLSEYPLGYVLCDEKLLVLDEDDAVGISAFAVEPATGRLTFLTRTVLDLRGDERMTCGPNGIAAIGGRLFRISESGTVQPLGTIDGSGSDRIAFHPSGRFLYAWREGPQQASLVTLAVTEGGQIGAFAETPISGHMDLSGMILVTRPAP